MASRPKQSNEQIEDGSKASTPQLDRLERLANSAEMAAQTKRWRARQDGMHDQGEPSEVRDLNHDENAKAQAEAAMKQMMAKPKKKGSSR
jgi:hypothetical protein